MTPAACEALLRRNVVGRLAFSFHDRVDIEPIFYTLDGSWLFGRTSPGTKLTVLRHSPWVAFEVDEVEGLFDWKSVVAHGTLYVMQPEGSVQQARTWRRGITRVRQVIPESGTPHDPLPSRTVVFGIHLASLTGRSSRSARASRTRPA